MPGAKHITLFVSLVIQRTTSPTGRTQREEPRCFCPNFASTPRAVGVVDRGTTPLSRNHGPNNGPFGFCPTLVAPLHTLCAPGLTQFGQTYLHKICPDLAIYSYMKPAQHASSRNKNLDSHKTRISVCPDFSFGLMPRDHCTWSSSEYCLIGTNFMKKTLSELSETGCAQPQVSDSSGVATLSELSLLVTETSHIFFAHNGSLPTVEVWTTTENSSSRSREQEPWPAGVRYFVAPRTTVLIFAAQG